METVSPVGVGIPPKQGLTWGTVAKIAVIAVIITAMVTASGFGCAYAEIKRSRAEQWCLRQKPDMWQPQTGGLMELPPTTITASPSNAVQL